MTANDESTNATVIGCGIVFAFLVLMPVTALYYGWALWLLWNWFAVPLAPAITWHAAVGLSLLIGFIKMRPGPEDQTKSSAARGYIVTQGAVLFAVGVGWIFHAIGFGANP